MSPTHCANCKCENPPGAKFCNACGARLQRLACPSCGAGNDAGATTCRQCRAALPEGQTRTVSVSSFEADARRADAEFDAAFQALRERLPLIGAEYAQAADRGGEDASADEPGPAMATARLADSSTRYPATHDAFPSAQPGHRVGRMRTTAVVFGAAALAAAGVAVFNAFDPRERADASPALFTAGEPRGRANSPPGARPASTDATDTAPVGATLPRVTHGVAKSATPVAAAAPKAGPSEGGAPRPDPSVAQREASVTSAAPAGDPLPRVTHGVAKGAVPAAATAAAPRERAAPQPGATTAQREDRAAAVAPAAGASAPPRAGEGGTGIERPRPARLGPCTEAVATLGLCNPESTQRRE